MRMFGVIVNPVSGGGENGRLAARVGEILDRRGQAYRLFETENVGDGDRQTRRALESGCTAVVCIGGDGTLSEIVDALMDSGCVLYIVPGGTGNDFARALGLPRDPIKAFEAQLDGRLTDVDCGTINGRAFINVSGSGFDVDVLRKTEELKPFYPGKRAYRRAVVAVVRDYRPFRAELSVDDGAFQPISGTIVEIANGQYIGGGMRVAPGARMQDGLFDVVTVGCVPRLLIPLLLPLFIGGAHVHLPVAKAVRAKRAVLRAKGMVVNIDGRLEQMDEARYEIRPSALRMKLPV